MKVLAKGILKLFGWSVKGEYTEALRNCIIIVAPHTSNWDFIWGLLARTVYGIHAKYLIKNTYFKPATAWFFRFTGGIPVDRSRKTELTDQLKAMLQKGDELKIVFTPEGTRKRVEKWKTGFYWVAMDTDLPIVMHYIDYRKKEIGMSAPFKPSGTWEEDREMIRAFYRKVTPGNAEGWNTEFL